MYLIYHVNEDGEQSLAGTCRSLQEAVQEARDARDETGVGSAITDHTGRVVTEFAPENCVLEYTAHSIDGDIPFDAADDEAAMKWVNEGDWSDNTPFPVTQGDREIGWARPDAGGESDV